jgi:YHYH protein
LTADFGEHIVIATLLFMGIGTTACKEETTILPNPSTINTGTSNGTGVTSAGTSTTTTGTTAATTAIDYSTIVQKAFSAYGAASVSSVTVDGDYIVIKCSGVPDHKSPYFKNSAWESTMFVADTRSSFKQAPGSYVAAFSYTFRIPKAPKESSTKKSLGTATIGIALNGVPIFNQYAAGNTTITVGQGEYVSFDLYGGHPAPTNDYHYHIEPNYITSKKGADTLIGYLMDGFPVYGSKENGKTVTNSDLDAYHGHTTKTAEYPNGIYHYHTTSEAPFINGNGFFGTAGTWTK